MTQRSSRYAARLKKIIGPSGNESPTWAGEATNLLRTSRGAWKGGPSLGHLLESGGLSAHRVRSVSYGEDPARLMAPWEAGRRIVTRQ